MIMKLCMEQYVLKLYKVYINDDPELTLTHFKTMSKLAKLVFGLTVGPDIRWAFTGPLVLWFPIQWLRQVNKSGCRLLDILNAVCFFLKCTSKAQFN